MSTETDTGSSNGAQILEVLERLSSRLDSLEAKVDALGGAAPAGNPIATRASTDPRVAEGLQRLMDRMDKIEAAVEVVGTFAQRAPVLSQAAGDIAGWAYDQAVQSGVDPIQAGQAGAALALKAGKPENIALAERMLASENVALVGKMLDQAPTLALVLEAAEKVDNEDLKVVVEQGGALTGKLAALLKTPELARLLDAGPKAVGVAESASTALVETRGQGAEPVGPFGAMMAMMDPDVKRAVGFGLAVAKRFGQKLG